MPKSREPINAQAIELFHQSKASNPEVHKKDLIDFCYDYSKQYIDYDKFKLPTFHLPTSNL